MKTLLIALIAVAAPFGLVSVADAGQYCHTPKVTYCKPKVYKVSTCEINRCYQCRTAYDHCGHRYTYRVAVITYKDHYSNGSWRTWTKTVRV